MRGIAPLLRGGAATLARAAAPSGPPLRRGYRLMRDHMSPVPQALLAHLVQMPEVSEARNFFQEGKLAVAIQHLSRADEISAASGMPELALLTGEALAYLQALSGNFSKEAFHREQCVLASQTLQAASPGVPTDLTLFDCLHNAVLTDIKCGLLNVATLQEAREVARRVGKGGQGLVRTCDMTEVVAAVDGSHPSLTLDEASERATALTEEIEEGCGGEAALTASAYLVLGSALHRISKESNGAAVAAKAAWSKGVQAVDSPCIEAEALVKVGGLLYLSRLHLDHKEYAEADQAASDALAAAEQAQLPHAVSQAVCQLGVVRKRTGDFIVAEGLFRSCTNALIQARPGRCLTTWEMVVLGTATEEHCDLLSSMTFNSHSRQPEADLVREKFEQIARAFPVTANAALRLRQGGLQHWYVRSFSPNLPTLLQQTD